MKQKNKFIFITAFFILMIMTMCTGLFGVKMKTASADTSQTKTSEYNVYYSTVVPTAKIYGGTTEYPSGSYTNAEYIKYVADTYNTEIAACYMKMPGNTYYINYASGTPMAIDGIYYFYCISKSGIKSTTVNITLDRTKPVGMIYGENTLLMDGSSTNAEYIRFLAFDAIGISTVYIKRPGSSTYMPYVSNTPMYEEGTYQFYIIDKSSNASPLYTVTIDRSIPSAQIYVDDKPFDNSGYTNGSYIRFESDADCYVKLPGIGAFVAYQSGVEYYKPGKYVFYGQSKAGSSTGEYTIVIDRTVKTLEFENMKNGRTSGDVELTWTDGDPDKFAPIQTVTVNGKAYTKGEPIYTIDTGVYKVKCVDAAGNYWETEFYSTKSNIITQTLQQKYYEAPGSNGEYFAFGSYESAFAFASEREKLLVRTGEWKNDTWDTGIAMDSKDSVNAKNGTYFIYKKSGNPNEQVAYFTEARLNQVIAEYAKIGIKGYYYWEKSPAMVAEGENLYSYSDTKTILAKSIELGENIACFVDGEEFFGSVYEEEGVHILTVCDEWGNNCEYTLIVVRSASELQYSVGGGSANTVTFDRTYNFKDEVVVSIADAYDEMAMFNVYDENGGLVGCFGLDENCVISKSGCYTAEAVNHAGKSEVFRFVLSLDAPKAELTENTAKKKLEITITKSVDRESHIQSIEIYKSMDNGKTWVLLETDDYGKTISLNTLSYAFRTTGIYKVVVTDEFRTGIDAVTALLEYSQPIPEGVLSGVENNGYTNGVVAFEWKDESQVTITKDGEEIDYVSGQKLKEDGRYVLTIENYDGYKEIYTFVIDTIPPQVVLEGVEDGESVMGDVRVTFTEEGATAELFRNGESLGVYISGTTITDSGTYKLIVTDAANNKTEVTFTIDKFVDYEINVNDKGLSNSVTVTANETVGVVLTKDGAVVNYKLGDAITEPAAYSLTLTDSFGNKAEISFNVVTLFAKSFAYDFNDMPNFEKVMVNGEEIRLNYGTLLLNNDGLYEIDVEAGGKTYTFSVTIDKIAPTLNLNGVAQGGSTTGSVILSDLSEPADLKVYLNESELDYKIGSKLTKVGKYKVVVTDECGNSTEYKFEIEKGINVGLIVLVVIAVVGISLVGIIAAVILKRRRNE